MFHILSYPLGENSPVWPGNPAAAQTQAYESIADGDRSNTTVLHLLSHSGTHLDVPKHANDAGPAAVNLPIESYIFFLPRVLEVPKPEGD